MAYENLMVSLVGSEFDTQLDVYSDCETQLGTMMTMMVFSPKWILRMLQQAPIIVWYMVMVQGSVTMC